VAAFVACILEERCASGPAWRLTRRFGTRLTFPRTGLLLVSGAAVISGPQLSARLARFIMPGVLVAVVLSSASLRLQVRWERF